MATKRPSIASLVDKSMEGRNLDAAPGTEKAQLPGGRFTPAPKRQVLIRLDDGDYADLQQIAARKGTKAAALIRQAVKEIIRTESRA